MRARMMAVRFVALSVLAAMDPGRAPAQPLRTLDVIELNYYRGPGAPKPIPGFEHHHAYLVDSVSVTGRRWEGQVRLGNPTNGTVHYDRLHNGEIVPAFGSLYRLQGGKLVRLKADEVPKGITLDKDSFVVPLMRNDTGSGQISYVVKPGESKWNTVFVSAIEMEEKSLEPIALLKVDDVRNKARAVRRGDTVRFGESEWTVRSIVPADRGRQLHGWVEFSRKK